MYPGTLTTHMCTGPHRSPGSCWQGHLLAAPPWGGGGNLTGGVHPSGRSSGPHTGLADLPSPQLSVLAPCPRPCSEAGQENLTPASLPLPPPRPFSLRGTVESHPAPNPSWGLHSPPYTGYVPPRPPSPSQSSLRSDRAPWALPARVFLEEALGRVGPAGGRGEVAPPSGAAGLCLCAHFGNCQFSSLANYLLGGGLKTVHTHKSPRDLNKRRWQVIFQHSPTLAQGAWSCRTTGGAGKMNGDRLGGRPPVTQAG